MKNKFKPCIIIIILLNSTFNALSQSKFEQLDTLLPTPNKFRTATGDVGPDYFQQQVNYDIEVKIDEKKQLLTGKEKVTYINNSPYPLEYLWMQLDQNIRKNHSIGNDTKTTESIENKAYNTTEMKKIAKDFNNELGYKIKSLTDTKKKRLAYVINDTMLRIDLEKPLKPKGEFTFVLEWEYYIYDRYVHQGRGGYEYFPDTNDYLFTLAQWYPRMCAYDDINGWQNKQFLGQGEFALEFGDFNVSITVPKDHIVAATGVLLNAKEVLTQKQYHRFLEAEKSIHSKPIVIVTEKEVKKKEKQRDSDEWATWLFEAKNVRDYAFATSRKFIWDGMAVNVGDKKTMAFSYYPKEGNPLWEKESTIAVQKALEYYSEKTFPYPYPQASSVHSASIGMEYPMICFNFGRPNKKGKYSNRVKNDMIAVIIHEVGHNFFPMIVNSDERQWTWLDEGLNTFLETETMNYKYSQKDYKFDLTWSYPQGIANSGYLTLPLSMSRPIMTNSDSILEFGYNAYVKPSAALKVLKYAILGPEEFDNAFKTYSHRWAFKRPSPSDFFRTMEDVTGTDLDWFWRGWFYTVDYIDVDVVDVQYFRFKKDAEIDHSITVTPNNNSMPQTPKLLDIVKTDDRYYREFRNKVDDKKVKASMMKYHIYEVELQNLGELVTPLILKWEYNDGTTENEYIPAEVWRKNDKKIKKVFYKLKKVKQLTFDPDLLLGDVNIDNNSFPRKQNKTEFDNIIKSN